MKLTAKQTFALFMTSTCETEKATLLAKYQAIKEKQLVNNQNDASNRTAGTIKKILRNREIGFDRVENCGDSRQFDIIFTNSNEQFKILTELKQAGFIVKKQSDTYITIFCF